MWLFLLNYFIGFFRVFYVNKFKFFKELIRIHAKNFYAFHAKF